MSFEAFLAVGGLTMIATLAAAAWANTAAMRTSAALAGAGLLLAIHAFALVRLRIDDAYITYRYARNLANGVGPVWNPGERVEGYTSFLWMLLLAVLHVVRIDLEVAALLLACASMVALFLLLWRVSLRLSEGAGGEGAASEGVAPELVLAGAGLLIAANSAMGFWSMSGLEVPLIAALVMALVLTYQRESRAPGLPLSALVLVAGVMTRPEMAFLAAVTGAFFFVQAVAERDARRWRHLATFVAIFVVLAGTWFAWRWSYYGYVFPNTYYVKVGPTSLMIDRGWTYVSQYWWSYLLAPALLASAALPFLLRGAPRRDAAFIAAISFVWIAAVVTEGGDVFFEGRFLAPIIAPLYVALVAALSSLLVRVPLERAYKAVAFAAAVVVAGAVVASGSDRDAELVLVRGNVDEFRLSGRWLRGNAPENYVTAVFASGIVPYFSGRPSLDMLGLTDETIAHTDVEFGDGFPGHEKYNIGYTLDVRRPELILVGGASGSVITGDALKAQYAAAPGFVPAVSNLIGDDRTWERYEMAAFFDGGLWHHFLVRKDIRDNVNADWIESKGVINNGSGRGE